MSASYQDIIYSASKYLPSYIKSPSKTCLNAGVIGLAFYGRAFGFRLRIVSCPATIQRWWSDYLTCSSIYSFHAYMHLEFPSDPAIILGLFQPYNRDPCPECRDHFCWVCRCDTFWRFPGHQVGTQGRYCDYLCDCDCRCYNSDCSCQRGHVCYWKIYHWGFNRYQLCCYTIVSLVSQSMWIWLGIWLK